MSLAIFWSFFYFKNIISVPFHPDEATQIFMSGDLELLFNNTSDLFFNSNPASPTRQNYRLLDAPLTKYTIGFWRMIFGNEGLQSDWNWSKSWELNSAALPEHNLLLISRISLSIFFPFSMVLFYLITRDLFNHNKILVFSSLFLFSTNSLLLLHARRAMAEGLLIFFLIFSLYTLNKLPKKWIFLSAIPIAFAINAKQSLIFLIPIALILMIFYYNKQIKTIAIQTVMFFILIIGFSYLLNPISWREPIKVAKLMILERQELSQDQLSAITSVTPEFPTIKFKEKFIAFIAQIFILPPAPQEISNYQEQLNQPIAEYFKNPIQKGCFRNLTIGTLFFLFSFYGFIISFFILPIKQKIIFSLGFMFLIIEIFLFIDLPFQRYYLPAIPFVILFAFISVSDLFSKLSKLPRLNHQQN
jgi:hypothetical protein